MRMSAYYYGFSPTGVQSIDKILSAVACAGKAYHATEEWTEPAYDGIPPEPHSGPTPVAWIQNAANDAARALSKKDEEIAWRKSETNSFCTELGSARPEIARLREALEKMQKASERLVDNLNEFGSVTDDVFVDDVVRAGMIARSALSGSKE